MHLMPVATLEGSRIDLSAFKNTCYSDEIIFVKLISAKDIQVCKYDDNVCLLEAFNKAIPILYTGDPKINLVPFDPLNINTIAVEREDSNSPVAMNITFYNVKFNGLKNMELLEIKGATKTTKGFQLELKGKIKGTKLVGDYEMSGKILLIPIAGKGPFTFKLDNVTFDALLIGENDALIRNGKEYLQLKDFIFKSNTTRMQLNFKGLYNGDKFLEDSTNTFLNENWRPLFEELNPNVEEAFSQIFKIVTNRLFAKVQYKDLFLPE